MRKLIFLLAASAYAQGPETQGNIIRSESRLVLVDTVVTDKRGRYIRDLTQKDFRVFEDNKEQTITAFSRESADASNNDDSRKHYTVLFFDDTTAPPTLQAYARQAALKFIDSGAGPDKPMATAELGASLRVTQNFTGNADSLKQAVTGSRFSSSGNGGTAALNDYTARSSLGALRGFIKGMGAIPGRKALILVAGGYPSTQTTMSEIAATIEAANRANVAVYPVVPSTVVPTGVDATGASDASTQPAGRRGGGGGGRGGGRGAAGGDQADTSTAGIQGVLYNLAAGSGGFVVDANSDVSAGLARIAKEPEEYYILGYVPAKDAAPGLCHTLKVKVDKGGEQVRSRNGYCEAKTLDVLLGTPTERDLEARMSSDAAPTVTGASLMTPFFYIAANTARVDAALELPAGALQFAKDKGKFRSTLNLLGIAYLADGAVKARFSDSVPLTFDDKKTAEAFTAKPFHYEKQFRLAPGSYNFRLVFSSGANQFGRLDTTLDVAPWDPGKFALSGLALCHTVRPAPEQSGFDPDAVEDYVPLVTDGVRMTPSGSNRFRRSEKVYLYGELYHPPLAQPGAKQEEIPAFGVHIELMDPKTGKPKRDLAFTRFRPPPVTGSAAAPFGMQFSLADIEPGTYQIRVTALDAKDHQAVRTVDVQLEN